tara:strand:- start:3593 stop:4252 length:660 start_codon:yes stop_codon:yes gene_type:complete
MWNKILILAISRKPPYRCVAGVEVLHDGSFGGWIRPVDSNFQDAIRKQTLDGDQNRNPVKKLGVYNIEFTTSVPWKYQVENKEITGSKWTHTGNVDVRELEKISTIDALPWVNGYSSHNGINDQVPEKYFNQTSASLALIFTQNLEVMVSNEYNRKSLRGIFSHAGTDYKFKITCPEFEELFNEEGSFPIGPTFLTLSLGEPYKGNSYKLVAGVFPRAE